MCIELHMYLDLHYVHVFVLALASKKSTPFYNSIFGSPRVFAVGGLLLKFDSIVAWLGEWCLFSLKDVYTQHDVTQI